MSNLYKNKVVLINGATGGLALEFLKKLKDKNIKLLLISKNKRKLNNLLKIYKNAFAFYCNFENIREVHKTINKIKAIEKRIDYIFNFAGHFSYIPINKIKDKDYHKIFNINCYSPLLFNINFISLMQKNRFGRIINIGSSSSYNGFKNTSLYCASKHALLGFSRSMKDEIKDKNIKIFDILPGSIKTKMGKKVKGQKYSNFLEPSAVCNLINNVVNDDSNLLIDELKITRRL